MADMTGMTDKAEAMRAALREIEYEAAFALQHQEEDAERCRHYLDRTLAVIELAARVARLGMEGDPPRLEPAK